MSRMAFSVSPAACRTRARLFSAATRAAGSFSASARLRLGERCSADRPRSPWLRASIPKRIIGAGQRPFISVYLGQAQRFLGEFLSPALLPQAHHVEAAIGQQLRQVSPLIVRSPALERRLKVAFCEFPLSLSMV